MALITLHNVDYGIGGPLLLNRVNLSIEAGERIALIGRNGAGKTTLLQLLDRTLSPDDGEIRVQSGVRVARVRQEVPGAATGTVFEQVAGGLGELGELLAEFHRLSQAEFDAEALGSVQSRIEAAGGWNLDEQVAEVIDRLGLDGQAGFARLSGGMKRRVLLGRALAGSPDVLLLDEPTNHLDIEAIIWLEEFLEGYPGSIVFVTHDRRFLRALATRILEIDRGAVTSWPGDWDNYLRRRAERLHAEDIEQAQLDKKLAAEEAWIRQGIKARRTRNEGRVRALKALRAERRQRREQPGSVHMNTALAGQSGKKVIEAENVSFAFGDEVVLKNFSTRILRGDRIGIIGRNGSGKSTLIRLLLGRLQPDAGEIRHGTNLEVAYYDQHREVLREDWNAADNVAEGRDFVEINGRRKHIIGYLQDFLFTPERARAPITKLSGGERNRLLLARLFARPSNFLVMDEPTNDLDTDTLDLLEERLAEYPGTLLLVSHDRDFLDRVVTASLVMEGGGRVGEYVGGYSDWQRQVQRQATAGPDTTGTASKQPASTGGAKPKPAKLSYKLARELEQLPARVEALEARMAELTAALGDPDFYRGSETAVAEASAEIQRLQSELDAAYARWEELEAAAP